VRPSKTLHALPRVVARTTPTEKFAQPLQHRRGPHQVAAGERQQAVDVAPHIEARPLLGRQREHEVRAHELQHRCFLEAGRRQCLPAYRSSHHIDTGTLGHQATSNEENLGETITQTFGFGKTRKR
jgi:hypothetical protein